MKRMHLVTVGVAAGGVAVGMLLAGAPFRSLLIPLLVLACPAMMILMMSMRGHGGGDASPTLKHRPPVGQEPPVERTPSSTPESVGHRDKGVTKSTVRT